MISSTVRILNQYPPPKNTTKEDKIRELRDKLKEFLAGSTHDVNKNKFTVNVRKWDDEKQKRFDEIISIIRLNKKITVESVGGTSKAIHFDLRKSLSQDAAIDECIEAFINQFKEDI